MSKMGSETGNTLTEQNLGESISQDYDFDLGGEDGAAQVKPDAKSEEKPKESGPAKGEDGNEDSQEDEEGDEGDEDEYNQYYDRDEIESIKEQQNYDYFEDIRDMRGEALQNGLAGDKTLNKITIDDYAPKEEDLIKNNAKNQGNKKNKKTKSMKSSHTGDAMDDRDKQF